MYDQSMFIIPTLTHTCKVNVAYSITYTLDSSCDMYATSSLVCKAVSENKEL